MKQRLSVLETARASLVKTKELMFFASALLQTKFVEDPTCPTAWTDMTVIGYNPVFVESLDVPTIRFVVIHELMHILLKHGLRRGSRDPEEWNKACLDADTQVLMADGREQVISTIKPGDFVWSPSGASEVLEVLDKGHRPIVELHHDDRVLKLTPDHRFLTEGGFISAELYDPRMHGKVLRTSWSAAVRTGSLSNQVTHTAIDRNWREVHQRSRGAAATWLDGGSVYAEGARVESSKPTVRTGKRLLGRDYRWRRDDNDLGPWQVLPTSGSRLEYVGVPEGMAGGTWVPASTGNQLKWKKVLANLVDWLYGGFAAEAGTSVPGNQSPTRRSSLRVHLDTAQSVEESAKHGTYARNLLDLSLAEPTGVTVGGSGETRHVFDLVTEHHVFSAEGILTHNCDYAINIMLKDLGFAVWRWALIDPRYRGMTAEQIYALREQEGDGKDKPDQGQGSGKPELSQGGLGGDLRPVPAVTSEQAATIDHTISKTLARASAIARQHGVMPGSLEAIISSTYEDPVPWEQVLIDYMTACISTDENWSKRNRRYSEAILPSHKSNGMDELTIVADSSGSMFSKAVFNRVAVAVNHITTVIKPLEVRVIWADDAECSNIDVFEDGTEVVLHPRGGGGTDMTKPLKYVEQYNPEVVLLLSDGYTPWPDIPTPYPLIVACTTDAPVPDWAAVVRIEVDA
jgi:predicted metal-dependent peptidase